MQEIRPLTSIRGLAALWVFFFHLFGGGLNLPHLSVAGHMLDRGYLAVDLFFVLSGFVMALTYRELFLRKPPRTAYATFLVRRVARVLPLNVVVVLAIGLAVAIFPPSDPGSRLVLAEHPGAVLANLVLIQDWGVAPSIDMPAWSVSVEMAIYLVFPVLSFLAWGRFWLVPALAGAAALIWLTWTGQGQVSRGFTHGDFIGLVGGDFVRGFAGFYLGLMCYRGFMIPAVRRWADRAGPIVLAGFILMLAFSPTDIGPLVFCPLLVLALAADDGVIGRILSVPPLHYLGAISYSIYLIHYPAMELMNALSLQSSFLSDVLAIVLTLVGSVAAYHLVERPARLWLRRLDGIVRKPIPDIGL